jgi:hypothetical protein
LLASHPLIPDSQLLAQVNNLTPACESRALVCFIVSQLCLNPRHSSDRYGFHEGYDRSSSQTRHVWSPRNLLAEFSDTVYKGVRSASPVPEADDYRPRHQHRAVSDASRYSSPIFSTKEHIQDLLGYCQNLIYILTELQVNILHSAETEGFSFCRNVLCIVLCSQSTLHFTEDPSTSSGRSTPVCNLFTVVY